MFVWSKDSKIASYPKASIRAAIPELAELWRNGAMDLVAPLRMSRVLSTPLPYAGSAILRVCACGVKNAEITPLLFCFCKKIARMSCSAYERGSSTLSFTRNDERNTSALFRLF